MFFLFLFLENFKERERERERIDAIVHDKRPSSPFRREVELVRDLCAESGLVG